MSILELDQSYDNPLTEYRRGPFRIRYAGIRSTDCREHNERGQDFLAWRIESTRAAFVLCDGVGQSFLGGIGAQVVGEALLEWSWKLPFTDTLETSENKKVALSLRAYLDSKKDLATQIIHQKDLSAVEPEMAREALDARRRKKGTQSNFVCGILDYPTTDLPRGRVLLFWLGDAKLQVWKKDENRTSILNADWSSNEGWSSQSGTTGEIHSFKGTLEDLDCVIAHSDGVDPIQSDLSPALPTGNLDTQLHQLGGDDVSYIEFHVLRHPKDMGDDLVSVLRKSPETPVTVQVIETVKYVEKEPARIVKKVIPLWAILTSIAACLVFGFVAGSIGYQSGRRSILASVPTQVICPQCLQPTEIKPVVPSTELPTATLVPTEIPAITETSTSTPEILGQGFPFNMVQDQGVYVYYQDKPTLVPETRCTQLNRVDAENIYLSVNGAYRVQAFTTIDCSGDPITVYLDGTVDLISNNILGIRVVPIE